MQTNLLPTEFAPQNIEDFVGPARKVAFRLARAANMSIPRGVPNSHLFCGDSGSGKSSLCAFALKQFEVSPFNVTYECGVNITVDKVRDLFDMFRMTSLFGGYRAIWLDEIDGATKEARAALLSFCGEQRQPRETIILATTNCTLEELDKLEKTDGAKGRITSRFQVHEVPCPTAEEAVPLVKVWLAEKDAYQICTLAATGHDGSRNNPVNMRALLRDVTSYMQR